MAGNHVIFIHPDGTSPSHFAFARFVDKGPDGRLNWDNLEKTGVYLGHMEDQLGGTSNSGAVTHATGAKARPMQSPLVLKRETLRLFLWMAVIKLLCKQLGMLVK